MARSYANVSTGIWRDPRWRALDATAQRVYMLVSTQPNISAVGALPLTIARWAAMAADTTPEMIRAALARLAAARWVAVDEATEELLVRPFVRDDNGYRNSKRLPVIRDAASEIESRSLRRALAVELERLGLPAEWAGEPPVEPDIPSDRASDSPSDGASDGGFQGPRGDGRESSTTPPAPMPVGNSVDNVFPQVDIPSDRASDSPSDGISGSERVVVTKGPYVDTPTPIPQPATLLPPPEAAPRETRGKRGTRIPDDFAVTPLMRTWHREHTPDVDIDVETANFVDYWRAKPGKDAIKADWIAAWRTWMRNAKKWQGERARPARNPHRPYANPADVEAAYGGTL